MSEEKVEVVAAPVEETASEVTMEEIVRDPSAQIISIRKFHKKVFKKAPLHHHFEELGWEEIDIVKLFWTIGFLFSMIGVIYGVWL